MAPRPLEQFTAFAERAREAIAHERSPVIFGGHHWDAFALCVEDGGLCVRQMQIDVAAQKAFLDTHGDFMPENAQTVSAPGDRVLAAATLDALLHEMQTPQHRARWGLR